MHADTDRRPFVSMGDTRTPGDCQACSCCNEEVAICAPQECHSTQLQCLCPGGEELDQWEQEEEPEADQYCQLPDSEGSPPCSELRQALSPGSPAHDIHSGQAESASTRLREPLPLQGGPDQAVSQQVAASHAHFHRQIPEPCWYCMKSLTTDTLRKLQLDFESLGLSPKGKRYSYQQDPRPHFGVAHSARSTPFPLWGCDGPLRRERKVEEGDQMGACVHCHLALPMDTLRWHEAKCLVFEGLKAPCGKVAK